MTVATEHLEQLPAESSSTCSTSRVPPAPQALSRPRTVSPGATINIPEPREQGLRPSGEIVPSSALMSALTTEHYTLQAARSSTIIEANGRSSLFLSAVSGALLALALVAQLDRLGGTFLVFAFSVLPALLMLGVMSYARLADLAVHDAYYARAIGRIRSFYFDVAGPGARQYWPAGRDDEQAVMQRHAGQRLTRWHGWTRQATAVAAVTAVIAGVLGGLAVETASPLTLPATAVIGVVLAVVVLVGLLADQERRWRQCEQRSPALFAPDGTPRDAHVTTAGLTCHLA